METRHAPAWAQTRAAAAVAELGKMLPPANSQARAGAAPSDPRKSACQVYHEFRGYVDPLLDWIVYIPGPGDTVVKVVRILEKIADLICPASEFASFALLAALPPPPTPGNRDEAESAARVIENILQANGVAVPTTRLVAFSLPSLDQVCQTYHKIKPFIDPLMKWVASLPDPGKTVAQVVTALEQLADIACPTGK